MPSGACTSGSTAHPRGVTRRASGGAATTSTISAEPSRGCRWRNRGTGSMAIILNHTIVPARDKVVSARFFSKIFGLSFDENAVGYFAPVQVNETLTLDFHDDVDRFRSEEHTSELQSQSNLVCRLLLEKKKKPRA